MTNIQKNELLQNEYNRQAWKKFLLNIIGDQYFQPLREPVEERHSKLIDRIAKKITRYANLVTADGKILPVFEVILQENVVIERNRVAVNELIRNLIRNKGREGALVTFAYSQHQPKREWRFSFIAHEESLFFEEEELVKTNPKRFTYVFGTPETHRTAIQRFDVLQRSNKTINDFLEAFAVEKLSKSFFNEYRRQYGLFITYLTGKNENQKKIGEASPYLKTLFNGKEKSARDFIKKMLGRIVFLYFIQRKGWLGVPCNGEWGEGNPNFMQFFFEESGANENFYPLFLDPLFFDTLSTKRPNDEVELIKGKPFRIPYLNGGLFERDEYLPKNAFITFPSQLFRDLFAFLGGYNFTIYESSPDEHTIAVDPEMLGHIFENLLEDNKDKGAFYTPKAIVHYMCQESLVEYLSSKNKKYNRVDLEDFIINKNANTFVKQYAQEINTHLDNVKICDPAIGSGAFPMGLLLEIYNSKLILLDFLPQINIDSKDLASGHYHYRIKENIIQKSIYGVDIEEGAVDIARLRFWLSLVVDENEPKPLPNLDFKIVVGDSLLSKFEGEVIEIDWKKKQATSKTQGYFDNIQKLLDEIVDRQQDYFHPRGDKELLKKEIRDRKIDLLINQLMLNKAVFAARNTEEVDLFIQSKSTKQVENEIKLKEYSQLIDKLEHLKNSNRKFKHFDWKLDFPDVLNEEVAEKIGFDIVIGNPPYIQLQKMGSEADLLQDAKFVTFARTGDVYCLFYEKGIDLLKPGGILTFITSNMWMKAGYGKKIRGFFSNKTNPLRLLDFDSVSIFDASVRTNVFICKKEKVPKFNLIACKFDKTYDLTRPLSPYIQDRSIILTELSEEQWIVLTPIQNRIKNQMQKIGVPLREWSIRINYGIKTGYDNAFVIDEETRKKLVERDPQNMEVIKPTVKGKQLKRYSYNNENRFLIFIPWHFPLHNDDSIKGNSKKAEEAFSKSYDSLYHYFEKFKDKLSARNKAETGIRYEWYALQRCANTYYKEILKPKILWGNLNLKPQFTIDLDEKLHPLAPCNMLTSDSDNIKYLCAILNAKTTGFFMSATAYSREQGYLEYKKQFVEQLPIPKTDSHTEKLFETLVDYVVFLYGKEVAINSFVPNSHIANQFEQVIDAMVFELYFEEDFRKVELEIIKYVERYFPPIDGKSELEKEETISDSYQKLRERDNEIRNNLKLMDIRLNDLIMPIKNFY